MRYLPLSSLAKWCAAILLLVIPAAIHGKLTNRWGPGADLAAAAARLDGLPDRIGDWKQLGVDAELSDFVERELQVAGYLNREYVHQTTGDRVALMLLVGHPGALSRHPPEICYGVRNQRIGSPFAAELTSTDGTEHEFRVLRLRQPGKIGEEFTVCYSFTVEGHWSCPEYPRVAFGGKPLLYKMQVLVKGLPPDGALVPEATRQFLVTYLPILRETAIQESASGTTSR